MKHECGACNGSGQCQNDFHNFYNAVATVMIGSGDCPACGEESSQPGNCSVCGGSGEQDD
jgi:hypothetical protein